MKRIYVLALSLMMISFSYGQMAQLSPELIEGSTSNVLKSDFKNDFRSSKRISQNTKSIQSTFFDGFEGGLAANGWTVLDEDADGEAWGVFASATYEGDSAAYKGYSADGNDDYLISPQLTVNEGEELSFWARSADFQGTPYLENFEILVSTTGTTVEDFTITLESVVDLPNTFTKYSYILTDNEGINDGDLIYVAIRNTSIDEYFMILDNFNLEAPATEPIADLSQNEFNFGYADIAESIESVEFTLSNVGINTITVSETTDISATDFTTTFDASAVSVEADASYSFTFTYTPSDLGEDTQDFVITTNVGDLTISLSGNGVEAPEGTLIWDNSDITPIGTFTSTELGTLTPGDAILADDFDVTSGQSWTISTIVTKGNSDTEAAIDHFGIKIFSNNNGLPGDELFTEEVVSLQNNDFFSQTLVLENPYTITSPGKYWISVYAIYDEGDDLETSSWGALLGSTSIGDDVALRDMGGLVVTDGIDWTTVSTSFTQLAAVKSTYIKIFGETEALTDPIAAIDREALNFGYVDEGSELTSTEITISNNGGGTLTVTDATDLSSTDFTTTFDASAVSATSGAPYTFTITYTPSDLGEDTEDFVITTNAEVLTIELSGNGAEAPVGTELWDNTEIGDVGSFYSCELGALTPGDITMADDFVIEAGESWAISSVSTIGFSNTTTAIDNFTLKIYADNNGVPGNELFSEAIITNQNNDFNNQTLKLATPFHIDEAGTYWINIYAVYANGDALATSAWSTYMGQTAIGASAVLKDSPNALGYDLTSWSAINTTFEAPAPSSLYFKIFGDITTNVNSIETTNINLFPNPTTGIVNITNTELNSVEVYNMVGQVIASLENVQKIDLSSFKNGTYIVKVISENNTVTKKVNLIK